MFCDHPANRRCCLNCCHHCWLLSQYMGGEPEWEDEFRDESRADYLASTSNGGIIQATIGRQNNPVYWLQHDNAYWLWPLGINEHGVHGTWLEHPSVFVPAVCLGCPFRDWDGYESGQSWTFCGKNIRFPVRKGTCKVYDREVSQRATQEGTQ